MYIYIKHLSATRRSSAPPSVSASPLPSATRFWPPNNEREEKNRLGKRSRRCSNAQTHVSTKPRSCTQQN